VHAISGQVTVSCAFCSKSIVFCGGLQPHQVCILHRVSRLEDCMLACPILVLIHIVLCRLAHARTGYVDVGSAVERQYSLCRTSRTLPAQCDLTGISANLIAASLRRKSQEDPGNLHLRAAFVFFWNGSKAIRSLQRTFCKAANRRNEALGLNTMNYTAQFRNYYVCPSLDARGFIQSASCGSAAIKATLVFPRQGCPEEQPCILVVKCEVFEWNLRGAQNKRTLRVALRVHSADLARAGGSTLDFNLGFCVKEHVLQRRLTVCSQTMYNYPKLAHAHHHVLRDWVDYHLHIGVDHFFLYDIDGSFSADLQPFIERGVVTYMPYWADQMSVPTGMMTLHGKTPNCAEPYAYTHCLLENYLVSQWVILLHDPDEYIAVPSVSSTGLQTAMSHVESIRNVTAEVWVFHVPMAARHGCSVINKRGSVLRCSLWRGRLGIDLKRSSPMLNPENCVGSYAHDCSHPVAQTETIFHRLPPHHMSIYHYVELLPETAGRCERIMKAPCDTEDTSLMKGVSYLMGLDDGTGNG